MVIKNGQTPNAEEVVKSIGTITAQNTNRILKSDTSVFVNEQFSGADDFTDSNGVMNTVDTGNTTGFYPFDKSVNNQSGTTIHSGSTNYILDLDSDTISGTTHDPDSVTDPENFFDGDDNTFAEKTGATGVFLGKTFGARTVNWVRVKASSTVNNPGGSGTIDVSIELQTFNGSSWSTVKTWTGSTSSLTGNNVIHTVEDVFQINASVQGVRVKIDAVGISATLSTKFYYLADGDYATSDTVETNSIITDIVPKSIVVYGDKTLPTNTSITFDVSDDGGSTFSITGKSFGTYIDTTSFSGGDLALKFNLSTSDTDVTPKLFGFGVAITDS